MYFFFNCITKLIRDNKCASYSDVMFFIIIKFIRGFSYVYTVCLRASSHNVNKPFHF